jgi:hypothetical protein
MAGDLLTLVAMFSRLSRPGIRSESPNHQSSLELVDHFLEDELTIFGKLLASSGMLN